MIFQPAPWPQLPGRSSQIVKSAETWRAFSQAFRNRARPFYSEITPPGEVKGRSKSKHRVKGLGRSVDPSVLRHALPRATRQHLLNERAAPMTDATRAEAHKGSGLAAAQFVQNSRRNAYMALVENSVKRDLAYLEIEKSKGADDAALGELMAEAQALLAKIEAKKAVK